MFDLRGAFLSAALLRPHNATGPHSMAGRKRWSIQESANASPSTTAVDSCRLYLPMILRTS
jgi:hypothetical protein